MVIVAEPKWSSLAQCPLSGGKVRENDGEGECKQGTLNAYM
jgi:hypothetical protein